MPYLNIDDGMGEHPKVEGLSDGAFRLHVLAMLACSRNQTDGVVTVRRSRSLMDRAADALAAELVAADLWHDIGQGCSSKDSIQRRTCRQDGVPNAYLVHDYLQWNHSKEWWTKRREKERERKDEYRKKKREDPTDGDDEVVPPSVP